MFSLFETTLRNTPIHEVDLFYLFFFFIYFFYFFFFLHSWNIDITWFLYSIVWYHGTNIFTKVFDGILWALVLLKKIIVLYGKKLCTSPPGPFFITDLIVHKKSKKLTKAFQWSAGPFSWFKAFKMMISGCSKRELRWTEIFNFTSSLPGVTTSNSIDATWWGWTNWWLIITYTPSKKWNKSFSFLVCR